MVHGSRVATGAESWLRRRPRAAAKKLLPLPVGSVAGGGGSGRAARRARGDVPGGRRLQGWGASSGLGRGRGGAGHGGRRRRGGRERGGRRKGRRRGGRPWHRGGGRPWRR